MKTLKTLQTVNKVLKVISLIAMIFTFIGAAFAFLGGFLVISLPELLGEEMMKTVIDMGELEGFDFYDVGMVAIAGAIVGLAQGVLLVFTYKYFKRACEDGTPFTHDGAKQLQTLGILTLCISFGAFVLAETILAIFGVGMESENTVDLTIGLIMIFVSRVYEYGASLEDKIKKTQPEISGVQ